ncbi:unnamed protein product [Polarella glacialis]|uniref:Uncharacterized protein n=1 Tax=Polarella glacialis TaxID=89957 RepID=A0A813EMA3_POLGL|nr:unnamed protein product [Polarella glacialis]
MASQTNNIDATRRARLRKLKKGQCPLGVQAFKRTGRQQYYSYHAGIRRIDSLGKSPICLQLSRAIRGSMSTTATQQQQQQQQLEETNLSSSSAARTARNLRTRAEKLARNILFCC